MNASESIQPLKVTEKDYFSEIDFHNVKKAAMVHRAINHKLRQQIIKTI